MDFLGHYNYWVAIVLMMAGFYLVIASGNLVKKLVGLNIFQTSVFLLYISMGKVAGGTAPGNHIGIWLVELGVGVTVSAVMVTIFLAFAGRKR